MSKELATYFSPFTPINQFSLQEMSEHKTPKGLIDVNKALRSKDAERIKDLEKEILGYKEQMRMFEESKKNETKYLKRFEVERAAKEEALKEVKNTLTEVEDLKAAKIYLQSELKTANAKFDQLKLESAEQLKAASKNVG